MKKFIAITLVAFSALFMSCSNNSTQSSVINYAANALTKVNNLLKMVPAATGIQVVDNLTNGTVSSLSNIAGLLQNTTNLYSKYTNSGTNAQITLTDIMNSLAAYDAAKTGLTNLRTTWKNVSGEVKGMTSDKRTLADKSLNFVNNAIDVAQDAIGGGSGTLSGLLSLFGNK